MIEPLLLKSEAIGSSEGRRSTVLTAAQLISQFSFKSPTNQRICLTDRAAPAQDVTTPKLKRETSRSLLSNEAFKKKEKMQGSKQVLLDLPTQRS
jgi:hypothetical protein